MKLNTIPDDFRVASLSRGRVRMGGPAYDRLLSVKTATGGPWAVTVGTLDALCELQETVQERRGEGLRLLRATYSAAATDTVRARYEDSFRSRTLAGLEENSRRVPYAFPANASPFQAGIGVSVDLLNFKLPDTAPEVGWEFLITEAILVGFCAVPHPYARPGVLDLLHPGPLQRLHILFSTRDGVGLSFQRTSEIAGLLTGRWSRQHLPRGQSTRATPLGFYAQARLRVEVSLLDEPSPFHELFPSGPLTGEVDPLTAAAARHLGMEEATPRTAPSEIIGWLDEHGVWSAHAGNL